MNYEEKYKNIFEQAKIYYNTTDSLKDRELLELLFPELKESDDNRIRKTLMSYLRRQKEFASQKTFLGIPIEQIIVWLEKQGKQKPNFCHHEVDLSGCSEEYCKAYYDGWNNCNQQHAQLEAEQKHAWSEEDEITLNSCIHAFEKLLEEANDEDPQVVKDLRFCYRKNINWLKSLKPQNTWKPSDEQMKFLWKYAEQNNYDGSILTSLYNDLKKLYDRQEH